MNRPATIAILDDDPGVREALASFVRSLGHAARAYGSGEAFLAAAEADPDCLITDIQMPGLSGDALQARLIASGRPVPMIFMTAFPRAAVRARVLEAGAAGFLEKPVDCDEIARLLAVILDDRAPPQTLV